uniref:Uncharacterized protein n=1 Tax=Anguilla anguilla TaxID=7936 RepID=A0A0E9UZP6_ANGAN
MLLSVLAFNMSIFHCGTGVFGCHCGVWEI